VPTGGAVGCGVYFAGFLQNSGRLASGWQYFGTKTGVFRTFPARVWDDVAVSGCGDFEFRSSQWYASAASGTKSIVILFDVSWSMKEESRFSMGIDAVSAVLDTLSPQDAFDVVAFGSSVVKFSTNLVTASSSSVSSGKVCVVSSRRCDAHL
jgi:von Willebrand factor type A domain